MAIKSSGTLKFTDIANEFGGEKPHELDEYYRGGGLVTDSVLNQAIPTSGTIRVSNFYGASRFFLTSFTVNGLNTTTFAQTAINQDTITDIQPPISGSYQKYYVRTFQGFYVSEAQTQITTPNMIISIRGDEDEDKFSSDENTGIRNPGVDLIYRSERYATPELIASYRGTGESFNDDAGNLAVSVTGGIVTCQKVGYYTYRYVADVFSEDIGQAPANIFIANNFNVSAFGVSNYTFLVGRGYG